MPPLDAATMPEPPPLPPGMPAEIQFQYDLAKWSTSTLYTELREVRKAVAAIDDDLDDGKAGALAAAFTWFGKLPQAVQIAVAVGAANLALAWGGALYEKAFHQPPPQTTIPTQVRSLPAGAGLGAAEVVSGAASASTDKDEGENSPAGADHDGDAVPTDEPPAVDPVLLDAVAK